MTLEFFSPLCSRIERLGSSKKKTSRFPRTLSGRAWGQPISSSVCVWGKCNRERPCQGGRQPVPYTATPSTPFHGSACQNPQSGACRAHFLFNAVCCCLGWQRGAKKWQCAIVGAPELFSVPRLKSSLFLFTYSQTITTWFSVSTEESSNRVSHNCLLSFHFFTIL